MEATPEILEDIYLCMQRGEKIFVADVVAEDGCVIREFWDSADKCLCTKTIYKPPGYLSGLKAYVEHKRDLYGKSGLRNMSPSEKEMLSPDCIVSPTLEEEWRQAMGFQNRPDQPVISAFDNAETLRSFHQWSNGVFKQDPDSVKSETLYYRAAPKESRFGKPTTFKIK